MSKLWRYGFSFFIYIYIIVHSVRDKQHWATRQKIIDFFYRIQCLIWYRLSPCGIVDHTRPYVLIFIQIRMKNKSPWALCFTHFTLIKKLCDLSELSASIIYIKNHFYLRCAYLYPRARYRRGLHRTVGVVFRRSRPALLIFLEFRHDVPDWMRWLIFNGSQPPRMTGALALLANSILNLHTSVIKRATTFEIRDFSWAIAKNEYYVYEQRIPYDTEFIKTLIVRIYELYKRSNIFYMQTNANDIVFIAQISEYLIILLYIRNNICALFK